MRGSVINCAVIGLGIGAQHAIALLQDKRIQLTDLIDYDLSKIQQFINQHNLQNIQIRSFNDIILDNNIDLVSIASFDDHHYEQVIGCLKNNKHVFVEKPLCQSKEQLNNIYAQWKIKQLALSSNLVLRKAPLYTWLKEVIKSGAFGEIYAFYGDYLYGRIHKITEGWRKDVNNYSVMQGGGIHIIDLMLWLTDQKPVCVQSRANKIVTQSTLFRYNDFQNATFFFDSGLIGEISANFGCVHKHQHVIKIFGTKATFIYDDMGPRIHWSREEDSRPEELNYASKPIHKGALINNVIDNIISNNVEDDAKKEFDLMSVVLTIDESLKYQQSINIEYLT